MNWLHPLGWWGMLAALPVISLYLLRSRRTRAPAPTLLFWEEVFTETAPRAWWRRLRHLVSLLLQLWFITLVTIALADPLTAGQTRDRKVWVLAVDRSASMSMPADPAAPEGPTRLEAAKQEALRWTQRIRDWDEAMVIAFSTQAEVRCGRTRDVGAVRRALRGISPSDMPGSAEDLLPLISNIRADERQTEPVVFTDGQAEVEPSAPVRWIRVGRPADNVGITGFAARTAGESRARRQIWVRVRNAAAEPRSVPVSLSLDGVMFDSVFFDLAAGEEQSVTVEQPMPEGGLLEARLGENGRDGLAADDHARLLIPPPRRLRVALLAPQPNVFVEQALAAQPAIEWSRLRPDQAAAIVPDRFDVAVLHRTVPDPLLPVPSLYLEPEADSPLWSRQQPMTHTMITSSLDDDPRLRHVRLDRTVIRRAVPLNPVGGDVLLEAFGAPVCVAWTRQDVRVAALGIDLDQSDLPLRTAFPIWMANILRWLAGTSEEPILAYRTGETASVAVGDADTVAWTGPGQTPRQAPLQQGRARIGPFERAGRVRVSFGDPPVRTHTLAVNLADPDETDGRRIRPAAIDARTDAHPAGPPAGPPLWIYLAACAGVLSAAEWWMYHRRIIE